MRVDIREKKARQYNESPKIRTALGVLSVVGDDDNDIYFRVPGFSVGVFFSNNNSVVNILEENAFVSVFARQ